MSGTCDLTNTKLSVVVNLDNKTSAVNCVAAVALLHKVADV